MRENDPIIGTFFTTRSMLCAILGLCVLVLLCSATSPAQAAFTAYFIAVVSYQFAITHNQLQTLTAGRTHLPRVFEGDPVHATLEIISPPGRAARAIQMLEVEDQFLASLNIRQRNLIPWIAPGWRVGLPYSRTAERHLGLYLIGPIQLRAADTLGIFYERRELPVVTRLTVYPRANPLPALQHPRPARAVGAVD